MEEELSYQREFYSLIYFLLFLSQYPHLNRNTKKLNQCCCHRQEKPTVGFMELLVLISDQFVCVIVHVSVSKMVYCVEHQLLFRVKMSCHHLMKTWKIKILIWIADLKQFGRSVTKSWRVKQHLIVAKYAFTTVTLFSCCINTVNTVITENSFGYLLTYLWWLYLSIKYSYSKYHF